MSGNFYSESVDIDIGINSHIYISVEGTPMEIFVDLYFEIIENNLSPVTTEISSIHEPTHYELFGYLDNTILSKYPISV